MPERKTGTECRGKTEKTKFLVRARLGIDADAYFETFPAALDFARGEVRKDGEAGNVERFERFVFDVGAHEVLADGLLYMVHWVGPRVLPGLRFRGPAVGILSCLPLSDGGRKFLEGTGILSRPW